jgi:hypothetical protein
VPPFDILDYRIRALLLIGGRLQDLSDTWMLQLGLNAGLVQETCPEALVLVVLASDFLDNNGTFGAFDASGRGEVHLTHASPSDTAQQRKTTKTPRQYILRIRRNN